MPEPLPEIPLRERVVVGMGVNRGGQPFVACQDGTVFLYQPNGGRWHELAPIPGTPRHYQRLGAQMDGAG